MLVLRVDRHFTVSIVRRNLLVVFIAAWGDKLVAELTIRDRRTFIRSVNN